MYFKRRLFINFLAGFVFLVSIILCFLFAPIQLGGLNEYVFINGNSMEPTIKQGDLIIVRQIDRYQIGDAVAYRNQDLQKVVFHRIVGVLVDRYIFRGDNNNWVDSYKPKGSDLIGKQWIQIPTAGNFGEWIRKPLTFALFNGALGGVILGFIFYKPKKMPSIAKSKAFSKIKLWINTTWHGINHVKSPDFIDPNANVTPSVFARLKKFILKRKAQEINSFIEISFFFSGLLLLSSIGLAIFAFSTPLDHLTTKNFPYSQIGAYSYNAASPNGVYDSQMINTGDPLFTKLTCKMNITFIYLIMADGLHNIAGTHQILASLSDPVSGWTRTIPLETKQSFNQDNFTSQVGVDFCQMQTIAKEMEALTGMTPNTYSIKIDPNVDITGQLQTADLKVSFSAPLAFTLDTHGAFMVRSDPLIDPLNPYMDGMTKLEYLEPNSLNIFNYKIPVISARILSGIGSTLSVIGLAMLLVILTRTSGLSKELLVRLKHGSTMIDVESSNVVLNRPVVDVKEIDDLAHLAERTNSVIFHETNGGIHTYLVEADNVNYRYILDSVFNNSLQNHTSLDRHEIRISAFNLQQGIDRGEFIIHYQPIVSILNLQILAMEAFLCWKHPQNGLLPAQDFINQAETTGLISILGKWMLRQSSEQVNKWQKTNFPIRLAVNFSRYQIENQPARLINQVLEQTGLNPDDLQIEISENSLLKNPESIVSNLKELKLIGVHLSVDDFTGASLLTNLKQLPFESIKIDRSLIMRLNQPQGAYRVMSIISSALDQGLKVVAEGVENEFQMNMLRSQYCSQAQGFLIAYPAPAEKISTFLSSQKNITQSYYQ